MSVRINLEIGHEASVRTKRTPEGFTHDWEVFVRGCDGAEIHYYIEKVVFYLHETFPKPKRVIKEPPYSVKESGYAGFNLPIEVYLRNKDEPKRIKFNYDLHLQPAGQPAIINVQKEKHTFNSLNDEFKNKLLRGGGLIVSSSAQESSNEVSNRISLESKNELTSKPRLSGSDMMRKNRMKEESRAPDSFMSLFGAPITKTTKTFPDLKSMSKDVHKNSNTSSSLSNNNKSEKDKDKTREKSKNSPNKDKDREKSKDKSESDRKKDKEDRRSKEKNREREHSKEKSSRREKSPPTPKRSPKRPQSPKRPPSPPPVNKHKEKDEKRELNNKEKEKSKDKAADDKSDKKSKKDKRDKDKDDRKENKHKDKESQRSNDYKDHKKEPKSVKEVTKEKEINERKEKPKEIIKEDPKKEMEIVTNSEKLDKKSDKNEEKQKHKHKKKDKDRKDREKEKSHKEKSKDKEKPVIIKPPPEPIKEIREEKSNNLFSSPKNEEKPKKISLFSEGEAESSNSSLSSRDETFIEPSEKPETKKESIFEPKKPKIEQNQQQQQPPPNPPPDKSKKEKNKKNKDKKVEKEERKRKRKNEKTEDEPPEKVSKEETSATRDSTTTTSDSEQNSNTSRGNNEIDKENQENPEDYMQVLRDLQTKIMNLQDNAELQKVVQLIAETGRYEVSQRTFDFDLCLLEKSTVRQLQEFFASSS